MFKKIKKIVQNPYVFSVIAKIFGVLVGFLFTVFQSRFLGAEIKGQIATVNSIISITTIVFAFGIYQAYPYYKRNSEVDILPIFMKLSLFLLAVYGVISAVTICMFDLSAKYIAVLVITPLLVYDGIVSYITLVETPNKRHATDMAVMLGELILVVILWLAAEPTFILGVVIIGVKDVTKAVIFTFWWRKRIFVHSESIWKWLPKLIKFGFFPMLSLLMSTLNYRVGILMMDGRVADAAIGVYSVGVLIVERIWMVPDAMKGVMVSNLTKGKDAREAAFIVRVCNTVCLIIALGIVALGQPFIHLVFGAEYDGAYQVILILLVGVFAMIYYRTIAAYNIAMGKQMISFVLLSVSVVINVVANLFLIPSIGIYGAGLASVISYVVCSVLFVVYFCRSTQTSFRNMLLVNRADCGKLMKKIKSKKG